MCTYPEVIPAIHIPLYVISWSLGSKGLKAMAVADVGSLLISDFFVLFVMTMIRVDLIAVSKFLIF